ncbi:TIGR04076 family protein [Chloroflexota bacterium]
MANIKAKVISQKGICTAGHKVGDTFIIGETTPPGLCCWAFQSLFPFVSTLHFSGSFDYESDPTQTTTACPDAANPVVFQITKE